ncbi:Clp protease ClpP [Alkalibaculum sp. M08DMB]|uniref:ATP-dependent Clp protease proteolytic subunit n=1 Tax=Alkalibaculum sporogenes TaxID=2655001 RepID=A0A6A7K7P4_9FIRM|nr:head maturation protease, ClpP-related [Alkalibaculum sporogenes]MPW25508.1 Clp protease ClpP [Alkalibaculum sporogenes]
MKTNYFIKQSKVPESMDLYIYDYVTGDEVNVFGEVTESSTSANYIKSQLENAIDVKTINIYINSYGGSVSEGLAIYNQLKRHPAHKIVHIDGFACSIASVIAMARDKVIMGSNTLMMIHHAAMGVFGNAKDLKKAAADIEIIDGASCSSYLAKAGNKLTQAKLTQLLDNETWLDATQCIYYGLADSIEGEEDSTNTIDQAKQRYKQSIQAEINRTQKDIKVPKELTKQKTNAEKLMEAYKNRKTNGEKLN